VLEFEALFLSVKLIFEVLKNAILKQKYPFRESTSVFAKLVAI
jgi:hypothetical protein